MGIFSIAINNDGLIFTSHGKASTEKTVLLYKTLFLIIPFSQDMYHKIMIQ